MRGLKRTAMARIGLESIGGMPSVGCWFRSGADQYRSSRWPRSYLFTGLEYWVEAKRLEVNSSACCSAGALFLISQQKEPSVILICTALVGFCLYAPFSVMVVLGQEYVPNHVGLVSGIIFDLVRR